MLICTSWRALFNFFCCILSHHILLKAEVKALATAWKILGALQGYFKLKSRIFQVVANSFTPALSNIWWERIRQKKSNKARRLVHICTSRGVGCHDVRYYKGRSGFCIYIYIFKYIYVITYIYIDIYIYKSQASMPWRLSWRHESLQGITYMHNSRYRMSHRIPCASRHVVVYISRRV